MIILGQIFLAIMLVVSGILFIAAAQATPALAAMYWIGAILSFAGAGLSYFLVGLAESIELLIISRVVVGLVKQTMTCSNALLTQLTDSASRAGAMGRLSSFRPRLGSVPAQGRS